MRFLRRKIGQKQFFLHIVGKGGLGGPNNLCDWGGPSCPGGPGSPGDLYGLQVRLFEVIREALP